jgi:hypothetical protein
MVFKMASFVDFGSRIVSPLEALDVCRVFCVRLLQFRSEFRVTFRFTHRLSHLSLRIFHSAAKSSSKTAIKWQASQEKDHLSSLVSLVVVLHVFHTKSTAEISNFHPKSTQPFPQLHPTLHNSENLTFPIVYLSF